MPDLRSALVDYSRLFTSDRAGAIDQSFVCSPLGAWLLLALVAATNPAATQTLGLDAEQAAELARKLVDNDHGDYLAALAAWSNRPFADSWLAQLPKHDQGRVPSAQELDRWSDERTRGLIQEFPDATHASQMEAVLATAVSTKTLWERPFLSGPVSWQGQSVAGLKRALTPAERGGVARVEDGEFAFVDVLAEDGGRVLLVVGDESSPPQTVFAAAYDIADALDGAGKAQLLSIETLPLGAGHSWTVALDGEKPETLVQTIPFELKASFDLSQSAGFKELTLNGVQGLFADDAALPVDSVLQVAMARFHAKGFEAAAVTAMRWRGMMMSSQARRLTIQFARPFAFLARDRDSLPWFSGWVAEPGQDPDE